MVVGDPLPEIESVRPGARFLVETVWKGGKVSTADLAPDLFGFKVYTPVRRDRSLFESVFVADDGNAIAWGDGSIDMPATAVERLASEQMTADALRAFMDSADLTRDGLAAQLGVSRRLVGYWLNGQAIPRYIMLACRALAIAQASPARDDAYSSL